MNFISIVILNHYVNTLVFDKCWNNKKKISLFAKIQMLFAVKFDLAKLLMTYSCY